MVSFMNSCSLKSRKLSIVFVVILFFKKKVFNFSLPFYSHYRKKLVTRNEVIFVH